MLRNMVARIWSMPAREEGQGLMEYALIGVLVVIAGIVGLGLVGTNIASKWDDISTAIGA